MNLNQKKIWKKPLVLRRSFCEGKRTIPLRFCVLSLIFFSPGTIRQLMCLVVKGCVEAARGSGGPRCAFAAPDVLTKVLQLRVDDRCSATAYSRKASSQASFARRTPQPSSNATSKSAVELDCTPAPSSVCTCLPGVASCSYVCVSVHAVATPSPPASNSIRSDTQTYAQDATPLRRCGLSLPASTQ